MNVVAQCDTLVTWLIDPCSMTRASKLAFQFCGLWLGHPTFHRTDIAAYRHTPIIKTHAIHNTAALFNMSSTNHDSHIRRWIMTHPTADKVEITYYKILK